jgi:integrase
MATRKRQGRARRGTGSIVQRGDRYMAQIDLGLRSDGSRDRRSHSFDSRAEAEAWLAEVRTHSQELTTGVADQRLADYLRWWIDNEAPKGKPGRPPLAVTTLTGYRSNIERHLIPALGNVKVGELKVADLERFANAKLKAGFAPSTVNRFRETLRSALNTAVRQDRLLRNVARYGGGVGVEAPPVDRFTDDELARILAAARDRHFYPVILLLARTGLRAGEACGLRWRDITLGGDRPRLQVVWQLDKWGGLVRPKSRTARRTIPLRPEVVEVLTAWRDQQAVWADRLGDEWGNEHDLVFTTRTGGPVWTRNVSRTFTDVQKEARVNHGSLKTLRSTVATQLAEAGVHPRRAQAFLGHADMTTTMKYYTAVGDLDDIAAHLPDL